MVSALNSTSLTEAVAQRYSVKKVFLEISQNSQENTCAKVSFTKYLQSDCSRREQYWPYCTLYLSIVLFEKENQQHSISLAVKNKNLSIENKLMIEY